MNFFPYGKAALAMLIISLVTGGWIVAHPPPARKATLVLWTFSEGHADAYKTSLPGFYKLHPGCTVDIELANNAAYVARLTAAMQADLDVPDMAELEISSAGTMFRGPVQDIGFVNLKPRLIQSGLINQIVASRLAPYTYQGEIFGMPQDVHPVQLAYHRDIFEKYGIDPDKLQTWDDFIAAGKRMTIKDQQYMIELSKADITGIEPVLLQRGGGYFDVNGKCTMDNEIAVQAMKFFVPLVAEPKDGPTPIGKYDGDYYSAGFAKAVDDGYDICFFCPDWRSKMMSDNCAPAAGKMALMPVPAVYPGGRRTTTWGGTMLGITKAGKHQDLAWDLAVYLYTNRDQLDSLFEQTNILPPIKSAWNMPVLKKPDPFFSNQRRGELYAQLAPDVPPQYTAPEIDMAKQKLSQALNDCVGYYEAHDGKVDDAAFTTFIRNDLHEKANDVRKLMGLDEF
jgi:arabinosaccharide transport system substrate-binding protein